MIQLKHITKSFGTGALYSEVLKDINLFIHEGEFLAIMGPSGSGKSTLLNILAALDRPNSGHYFFQSLQIEQLTKEQLALYRRYHLGFVFQNFNLLKKSSALENVEMPLIYLGVKAKERYRRSKQALERVGLSHRLHYRPEMLSGGQQQRVAIARAIVTEPKILIADEPTGNLDTKRSHEIMQILKGLNEAGMTIIMVTHEKEIAHYANKKLILRDGRIQKGDEHAL